MGFSEQLKVLQAAQGHPAKLALATVDLAYPALRDSERASIREGLEAAAIPHWCDGVILEALLEIPGQKSAGLLVHLRALSVVEPFPARGEGVVNVHEASRLAVRKWMAVEEADRFRKLSARAAGCFADDLTPAGRIEWIYHLLSADPELGADELEKFDREWSNQARPEDRYALAAALKELDETQLVTGRARVWVLLSLAWARVTRGETGLLANAAAEVLALARSVGDERAEGDAQWLVGQVLTAEGNLPEAYQAFLKKLEISRKLAAQDPCNVGWQRELAVAYSSVGNVLGAQGSLQSAQQASRRALAIIRKVVAQNPGHSVWRRDLSGILTQVGNLLLKRGQLTKAKTAFAKVLSTSEDLIARDPTNADLQLELAVSHSLLGGVARAAGNLKEAQEEFQKTLAISLRLAALDPTHALWQRALSGAHNHLGDVLEEQGQRSEAENEFAKSLAIDMSLATKSPTDASLQRELAVSLNRVGTWLQDQERRSEAQSALGKSLVIHRRLVVQDPTSVEWQHDLALACVHNARVVGEGDEKAALSLYDEAIRIFETLIEAGGSDELGAARDVAKEERARCFEKLEAGGKTG